MSLDLGTLAAKLKLDDSQFVAGLNAAPAKAHAAGAKVGDGLVRGTDGKLRNSRGQFARAGESVGQSFGTGVHKGAGGSLGKLGGLVAGLGLGYMAKQILGFGLTTAMGMEKAEISFTTMLGSASKAQSFIAKMKDFAATTPFEFPELQTAAGKLMAAGITTNKIIPIMTTLGNVTSGMGTGAQGVDRATVALQQMNAAGRITAEDLNQLRDAGVPVYDLLAAATGKSKKAISEMAREGKLGKKELDAMMKALETGKGLEKFNGLMEKQSKSLEGRISTLKDLIGQGLADAIRDSGLESSLKGGLDAVTAALPPVLAGLKGFLEFLLGVGAWVGEHSGMLLSLATVIGVVAAGYAALAIAQSLSAAGGFLAFAQSVMKATKAWAVVQWLLNTAMAANPIALVVIAIAALVAGLVVAYNSSEEFRNIVDAAFKAIGEAGRWLWNNALAPALRAIVNGFAWVTEGLAGMFRALGAVPGFEWATDAANNLDGMARSARDAANGIKDIPSEAELAIKAKDEATAKVKKIDARIKALRGKIVEAKAKGDATQVDKLRNKINALRNKALAIMAKADPKGVDGLKAKIGLLKNKVVEAKAKGDDKAVVNLKKKIDLIRGKIVEIKAHVSKTGINSINVGVSGSGTVRITTNARGGYVLPKFSGGGSVKGYSPSSTADNILSWLTAKEYVQPVDSVQHYGVEAMEAIRKKEAIVAYGGGGLVGSGGSAGASSPGRNGFTVADLKEAMRGLAVELVDSRGVFANAYSARMDFAESRA